MKTIKTLGVATAMALALIAFVGVGSASANLFKVSVVPANWTGGLAGKSHKLTLGEETFTCTKVGFFGETTLHSMSEVTVSPELGECSWVGALTYNWAMNGCKFRFNAGPGPELKGTVDITGCEKPMTFSAKGCTITIGNQGGLGTVTYKNVAGSPSTVTAVASLTGITYTRSGPCGAGSPGTFHDGTYTGEWTVKGSTKPGGAPAGVEVESTLPAPPSLFAAEEAPVTLSGIGPNSPNRNRISPLGGNGVICSNYSVAGTVSSTVAETLTVVPTFKECKVGAESVPDGYVSAGGCSYVFHVNGKFDIAGANCASNPMTITRAGCVASIGPQSGFSGLSLANEGSGRLRSISISGQIENFTYHLTGPKCSQGEGTFVGGALQPGAKVTATNSAGELQGISIE